MKKQIFKRLYFDIETSPNEGWFWNIGREVSLDYTNIRKERAVICICWKWEHGKKLYSLTWNRGDDKQMLKKFITVLNSADEIYGHNSDKFDIKWLRTRCVFHRIPMFPNYQTVDTLKLSRGGFKFNSNRLNYLGKFLQVGEKVKTENGLWDDVVTKNSKSALKKMVRYCKGDVILCEAIFNVLNPYVKYKTHVGVFLGKPKHSCPECGSKCRLNGIRVTATGLKRQMLTCTKCGKYHTIAAK